jgi:hypothetical protein
MPPAKGASFSYLLGNIPRGRSNREEYFCAAQIDHKNAIFFARRGVRSFFSVKTHHRYGRINLQDTNSACEWNHSGARGSAKAYAGGGLRRAIE